MPGLLTPPTYLAPAIRIFRRDVGPDVAAKVSTTDAAWERIMARPPKQCRLSSMS